MEYINQSYQFYIHFLLKKEILLYMVYNIEKLELGEEYE